MARWIRVLKDGEWAFIRPEAVDGVWVYDQGGKRYIHFDVGGRSFYLHYPVEYVEELDIVTVKDWLDSEYDGVLTLWHFTTWPDALGLVEFLTKLALYNTLYDEKSFRAFRYVKKVRQLLDEVITEHALLGEPFKTLADISYPHTPGWVEFDLPKFERIRSPEGIVVEREGSTYYVYLPTDHLEDKDLKASFLDKHARSLVSLYKLAQAIKKSYPRDSVF